MHDIAELEEEINKFYERLRELADDNKREEFIRIIHRPGWTTVAEYKLVAGLVGGVNQQLITLQDHLRTLYEGSESVGAKDDDVS